MKKRNLIITFFSRWCIYVFFFTAFIFCAHSVYPQSFNEGKTFFASNQPDKAVPFFKKAILEKSAPPVVYNYLGISFLQLADPQQALQAFLDGTKQSGSNKRILYYNAGTAAFLLENYQKAIEYFSYSITADSAYAAAYLNRANTHVRLADYEKAISDYSNYLVLEPDAIQAEKIKNMIQVLNNELVFQKAEAERIAAEEKRIKEEQERLRVEQERLAAEQARIAAQKAAEEEERRRKILEEVSASLQKTESVNLSAGTEGALDYQYEEAELE